MSPSLFDLVQQPDPTADRIYGVVSGIVTSNQDPDKLGRVKVRFPWLSDDDESWWAPIVTPMAGNEHGVFFLPEVDQKVLVVFEHGDVRFPYVIGALWTADEPPPQTNDDGNNDIREINSRSGQVIRLNDKDGEEKIEIVSSDEKVSIVVDVANSKLAITAESDLEITSGDGKLALSGHGVEITSQAAIKVQATNAMDLKSDAEVNVKGSAINLN